MNPFGNAEFMVGEKKAIIRFIPQGVKDFFTLESSKDGEVDVAKLNALCLRFALVEFEGCDVGVNQEVVNIHGRTLDVWNEVWYRSMPSGVIEAINNHIYVHNNLSAEKVDGLNFI